MVPRKYERLHIALIIDFLACWLWQHVEYPQQIRKIEIMIPEILLVLAVLVVVAYLIINKYHPALSLIMGGLVLLLGAWALGHPLYAKGKGAGFGLFDVVMVFKDTILAQVSSAGIVIMVLFGYSAYMSKIGANDVAVNYMVRPLRHIKHKTLIVPAVFLVGNIMSLVVPSASSLAIILMSILYPVLVGMGVSSLTAAGVIACTATIMPTPLGADNVIAAKTLKYDLLDYVAYNAKISIPALLIMALAHFLWQQWCDKREGAGAFVELASKEEAIPSQEQVTEVPGYYAIFPLLPLILILGIGVAAMFFKGLTMDITVLTFIAFFIVMIVESCRRRSFKSAQAVAVEMIKGMGTGFSQVVMLVVGGALFTTGIQKLGLIDALTKSVEGSTGAGLMVALIFALATCLFGILSGGGLAMFYAVIALIPGIAAAAGVGGIVIALPMQMIANLTRGISPVAAVIMIVAATIKVEPTKILKRTCVPAIAGILCVLVLSFILLPY